MIDSSIQNESFGKKPLISVIIVNYNGRHLLGECLSSLAGQVFRDFETILIDNGSADGSVEFVTKNFPDVNIVKLDDNMGFCGGNNVGLLHATGDFIALLNNDTLVDSMWLEELNKAMREHPDVGICSSCIVNYYSKDILDTAGDGYDLSGVGFKIGEGMPVTDFREACYVFGACAGAVLYRRSMIEKTGFFDERFFAYGEDLDLSFRAMLAGYKCLYVPEAIVYHKINQTVGRESDFLLYHTRRNVEYTYFKNMPLTLLLLTLPLHLIYNMMTFFQAICQGRQKIFLKAKLDFFKNFEDLLIDRKKVQESRKISNRDLLSGFSKDYLYKRLMSTTDYTDSTDG